MFYHHIDKQLSMFAHKNISDSSNTIFTVTTILLVLMLAAQGSQSINSTTYTPNPDTIFYRIEASPISLQQQLWNNTLTFLRSKKRKLAKTKCYLTVDETYESYTGQLHKIPLKKLTKKQKIIRRYIHKYKPKKGDTGSFKYLVFALVYGNKKRVLWVKPLRRHESYWVLVAQKLRDLYKEVRFEYALLDRGFYVAELIDQLQKEGTPFIIRAKLSDYMKKILGIYYIWEKHQYRVAGKTKTTLILGRDWHNRRWGFVTNGTFTTLNTVRHIYKKRWNIENIFKATDGIELKVATPDYKKRFFSVCFSFLVYNMWQRKNKRGRLLDFVKSMIEEFVLEVISCIPYRDKLKLNVPLWSILCKVMHREETKGKGLLLTTMYKVDEKSVQFSYLYLTTKSQNYNSD